MLTSRFVRRGVAALASTLALTLGQAAAEPAINQFELKDLDAEPGGLQFQSQNAHSWGQPRRRAVDEGGGQLKFDDNSVTRERHALEMEMGLTHWLKTRVGIEYEKDRVDDPATLAGANAFDSLKLSEVAVEGIVVFVSPKKNPIGLGMVAELQHPVDGDANTLFIGPIIEIRQPWWSFSTTLSFVRFMGGEKEDRDEKWDFSYASQLKYRLNDSFALALEAYGTIDRIGDTGHRRAAAILFGDHDQHRLGPVLYYAFKPERPGASSSSLRRAPRSGAAVAGLDDAEGDEEDKGTTVTLGVGLLAGLNENTPDATLKWSVEIDF